MLLFCCELVGVVLGGVWNTLALAMRAFDVSQVSHKQIMTRMLFLIFVLCC